MLKKHDIKTIYKITKQLINKNLTTQQPVKDENGCLLNLDEEQLFRWRSHFSSVLNHNLAENAPPLSAEPLRYNKNSRIYEDAASVAEIGDAMKSLLDSIPTELLPPKFGISGLNVKNATSNLWS